MFSTHLTAPRHSLLRDKLLPLRVAKTNIDRRGSSDAECCEEIFCRAEICFFNCKKKQFVFHLFWTDQQGMFLN